MDTWYLIATIILGFNTRRVKCVPHVVTLSGPPTFCVLLIIVSCSLSVCEIQWDVAFFEVRNAFGLAVVNTVGLCVHDGDD